jgi:MFS family permease
LEKTSNKGEKFMMRIILGAIVGFIVWSILWVGSDAIFSVVSPDWGKASAEFREAVANKTPYTLSSMVLIALLVKSVIVSIVSGFITALIAKENTKSTLGLGILLLLFGIFIQAVHWNYMPLWYHIPFLTLLIPMAVWGGNRPRQCWSGRSADEMTA